MKKMPKDIVIDPNAMKTRDHQMVAIINGVTKGGAHKNHFKEAKRNACRGRYRGEE